MKNTHSKPPLAIDGPLKGAGELARHKLNHVPQEKKSGRGERGEQEEEKEEGRRG